MQGKDKFIEELESAGYTVESLDGSKIAFEYAVINGKFKDRKIKIGLEIPTDFNITCPTGPHLSPRLIDLNPNGIGNDRAVESPFGAEWEYLSRPYPDNGWPRTNRKVKAYLLFVKHIIETL